MSQIKYEKFFDWIRQNNGYVDPDLYIFENENKERILRTKSKKVNTEVMIIPKKCCILSETQNNLEIMSNMLKEFQNPNSFYKPYIDILPSYDTFSKHVFSIFSEADIPSVKEICLEAGSHLEKLHECFKIVKDKLKCSEMIAKYIYLLYNTRSWSNGFIPLIDMMNHSDVTCNVNPLITNETSFVIRTGVCDDELINCYRSASFIELYMFYNIPFGSRNDLSKIFFHINDAKPEQIEFLKNNNLYSEPMYFYFNDSIVLSTFQKARILTKEKDLIPSKYTYKGFNCIANDRDAINYIFEIINQSLIVKPQNISSKYKIFEEMTDRYNTILKNTRESYIDYWKSYIVLHGTYLSTFIKQNINIDHIFISHYTKLTDRKACMMEQIDIHKLNDIAPILWVDFFDRENLKQKQIEEYVLYRPHVVDNVLIPAQISNALGHYYAIEKIANDEKINIGMIVEDDIIFKNDYVKKLRNQLEIIPDDWDIFIIGGYWEDGPDSSWVSEKMETDKHFIYKPVICNTPTGNYMLNKKSAKRIISHPLYKPFSFPIDGTLFEIAKDFKLNVYWSRPFLSFEGSKKGYYETSCIFKK